jgi:uncharacterized protein YecE (DUF72 family)
MLYLGTSGFKFDDWKGRFYPEKLPDKDWLLYYGERFNALEVNSTYYRLLPPATFFHMANKVPESFLFTVKTYKSLTHERGEENEPDFAAFLESLQPLVEAKKFGCVLAQFPSSFHNTPGSRHYLSSFVEHFSGYPLVVEFRNREWLRDEVFNFLQEHQVGFCGVDEPQFRTLMPPLARLTSNLGYVRFHGRNYKDWWGGQKEKRYDYLYSEEELREWLPRLRQLEREAEKTFVFMNNCYQAQAATNALQLQALLGGEPAPEGREPGRSP